LKYRSKLILASAIFLFIVVIIGVFLANNISMPTRSSVQEIVTQFKSLVNDSPFLSIIIALLFSTLIHLAPLPLTALTSLSIGAMYGLPIGFIISLSSSMIAAILLFHIGKFGVKGWLASKYHSHAKKLSSMVKSEKIYSLISVRWIPGIPFFFLNIAFGLVNVSFKRFLCSSIVGLSIPTLLMIYAGSKLNEINSFNEILSAKVFLVLFLLGVIPIALQQLAKIINKSV